ncbi:type IV secretion system protein [Pseudomonas sp. Marseille-Q5115]|uniref:type IV secretion system protein n=1 Tax=Pseudomonas sp. Marseille-Q5115 TaxID=2866593 RepID=UPI001CE45B06|nr:type IV secretion system protein [Pseudomonas sp. Marseille-Q5115]
MELHIAQQLYDSVDASLQSTLVTGMGKVMLGGGALFGTFWLLSFTLKSIFWLYQGMTVAFREAVLEIAKIAFIAGLAWNVTWFVQTIIPFVTGFPPWMGGILSGQEGNQVNQIDSMIVTYVQTFENLFDSMDFSITNLKQAYLGLQAIVLYLLGGIPFLLVAVSTLMMLKVSISIMLCLGPLFIAFALFPQTKQWFWGWVALLAGFMLTQVLFSIVLALEVAFINTEVIKDGVIDTSIAGNFSMLFYFATFTVLATQLPNYAASVMGGAPMQASGIGGLLSKGTGVGAAINASRGASKLISKIRTNAGNRIQ